MTWWCWDMMQQNLLAFVKQSHLTNIKLGGEVTVAKAATTGPPRNTWNHLEYLKTPKTTSSTLKPLFNPDRIGKAMHIGHPKQSIKRSAYFISWPPNPPDLTIRSSDTVRPVAWLTNAVSAFVNWKFLCFFFVYFFKGTNPQDRARPVANAASDFGNWTNSSNNSFRRARSKWYFSFLIHPRKRVLHITGWLNTFRFSLKRILEIKNFKLNYVSL